MDASTTQQDDKAVNNPTGKGGFGEHPENRNPGGWKKEDSISYQYNRFLRMSDDELNAVRSDRTSFTQAMKIALRRIEEAENDLNTTKEITDRTEGKAPQSVDLTSKGHSINPYAGLSEQDLRKLANGQHV